MRSSVILITVCSSSQKASEIIKIEWHLHFSTISLSRLDFFFLFCFTLLARRYQFSLSLSSRSTRRCFRVPIDRREKKYRRERSLKSWQTVVASSFVFFFFFFFSASSSFVRSPSFLSGVRRFLPIHSFSSECYFLCDGSSSSKKWFPHSSLLLLLRLLLLLLLSRPSFCSDVV